MGSNKIKKKQPTVPAPAPAGSVMKRFGRAGFWMALMAVGLWALMNYSTPTSNLEPYNFNQPEKISTSANEPADKPLDLNAFRDYQEQEVAEIVKTASDSSVPKSPLPRAALEHISKGMQLTEEGKGNAAQMEFEKAAKISPDSPELFSIWGASLKMQKKYKGANKRFARAHELAPNDPEIVFNWGMSLLEEQSSDKAIAMFKKTLELEPKQYMAYNFLGKAYGQKKMYAEETESYRKSIALNPDLAWPHFSLGVVLGLQKKFEEAADHFEHAIKIDKSFEKPFVVQMLIALGRYNPAAAKMTEKKKDPVKTAKADPAPAPEKEAPEEKKSEGSDHKMEGSKNTKETTRLGGKVLVNGQPLGANAVVFLETKNKLRVPGQKKVNHTIRQSDLEFFPKHSVVLVGSTVTFSNDDMEVHNIYSKSQNNQFNLGAMAAGSSKSMKFSQPGPVVLRCNLHRDMMGTLFVVPNGYYTHPDADGIYFFDQVKSQGYLLQVWHPQLIPSEVETNMKQTDLTGVDQTLDFDIKSQSKPGEIHDLVDPTDYNSIVDNIEKEVYQAIADWKAGKKSIPIKRMLMAITKHYDGEGLKGAIAKSFSEKRSLNLEKKLDAIRKQISGIGVSGQEVTEESLKSQAKFTIGQLRNNVRELEARLNPGS